MNDIEELISGIQGWFDFRNYYDRIAAVVPGDAMLVELGPWLGKSTIYLAHALMKIGKGSARIYAIDTWKGSPSEQALFDYIAQGGDRPPLARFLYNVDRAGVGEMVTPVLSDSVEAAGTFDDKSLSFTFYDTDHTEEQLSKELLAWMPKMKPGCFFGGHDIAVPGVRAAVRKLVPGWREAPPCWEAQAPQ